MLGHGTQRVKAMYEEYPYPSPIAGDSLIHDTANLIAFVFPGSDLAGRKILDAGCGSGHRLVASAKAFPKVTFLGVDMTQTSLNVARALAQKHGAHNVTFVEADLLNLDLKEKFDVVFSGGVVHHLEDPAQGLRNLRNCLTPGGVMLIWLYHAFGEFGRLLERELVLTLWDREHMSLAQGVETIEQLGVKLSEDRYGCGARQKYKRDVGWTEINVDGYLHPIVNAYRFADAFDLLARSGIEWVCITSVNMEKRGRLVDLDQVGRGNPDISFLCVRDEELLPSPQLVERFKHLSRKDKYRVLELVLKPTGFALAGGMGDSYLTLDRRLQGNVVLLNRP